MALIFDPSPIATLKGKSSTGESISLAGITTDSITPAYAAAQANKLLAIGGKNIVADTNMYRTQKEVVEDDE